MSKLTHFNKQGAAHMVDITKKTITHRIAIASGSISMQHETLYMICVKQLIVVWLFQILNYLKKQAVNLAIGNIVNRTLNI